MKAALEVPYADAAATDLVLSFEPAPRPSLASLRRACAFGAVELHVLGASHQVVVEADHRRVIEVVACSLAPEPGELLPERAERIVSGLRVDFAAGVDRLAPAAFATAAARLEGELDGDEHALVAVFPGRPAAITGLRIDRADDAAVAWRSWHAYPQRGEIVSTRTTVQLG